jgi:DNA-binding HxlR family transcriptional regulator
MRNKSKQVEGALNPYTESLVVHQVLGHKRGYPLTRLRADLDDINPEWIEESIASLERAGVVAVKRTRIHPSVVLQRVDDLDMVAI